MTKAILSLSLLIFTATWSPVSHAQSPSSRAEKTTPDKKEAGFIAKGIKAGLVAASFEYKSTTKTNIGGGEHTSEWKSDGRYGFAGFLLGYEHLRQEGLGFNTDLTMYKYSNKETGGNFSEVAIFAASVNMNYGFAAPVSIYGGLNLSRATQGLTMQNPDGSEVQPMGIGYQIGAAYNFSSKLQMNLGYHSLSQKAEYQIEGKKVGEAENTQSAVLSGVSFIF